VAVAVPKDKPAKRHHLVPKFYLQRFADSTGQLLRVPLGDDVPHRISITNATVHRDFYTVDRAGFKNDAFESSLASIESTAAVAFGRLIDGLVWPISNQDRYDISVFIALQHLRTSAVRQAGDEIYRAISKLEVGTFATGQLRDRLGLSADTDEHVTESIRAELMSTADTFAVDSRQHLKLIANLLEGFTRLVYFRRPWILVQWQRKTLATSDTPVVLVPSELDRQERRGPAFGTADELLLPLSRRASLSIGALGAEVADYRTAGNALLSTMINRSVALTARRAIFHHPDDQPLAGLTIPPARDRETNDHSGFTDDLIRAYERIQGRSTSLPQQADGYGLINFPPGRDRSPIDSAS
jgi:hypothetical protein